MFLLHVVIAGTLAGCCLTIAWIATVEAYHTARAIAHYYRTHRGK